MKRSHFNISVFNSRWEANEAFELDRRPRAMRMAGLESEQQMYCGTPKDIHEIMATHYA